jgi:hypothetical protein
MVVFQQASKLCCIPGWYNEKNMVSCSDVTDAQGDQPVEKVVMIPV